MFKDIIERILRTAKLSIKHVDRGNARSSLLAFGMIEGYLDVLKSMGHKAGMLPSIDDNGCEQIRYMEIDGIVIVRENKIIADGYAELLEK